MDILMGHGKFTKGSLGCPKAVGALEPRGIAGIAGIVSEELEMLELDL